MLPTPLVEYLISLRRPGGGRLVSLEAIQILIPIFPPNVTLSFSAGPIAGDYGQIVYGAGFGPNMVPNAFTGYLQIWGTRQIVGTFTAETLETEFQSFLWVTEADPALIYVTNVSGLNQVLEMDYTSLRVSSEEDYNLVLEELARMTSAKLEQLAREANALLRAIAGGAPAPMPPIEESP